MNHGDTKPQRYTGIFYNNFLRVPPCLPASVVQNLFMYLTSKMKLYIRPFKGRVRFDKSISMEIQLKQELHQLVDQCDNKELLEEAKILLEAGSNEKDWWDELTDADKSQLMESEAQYGKGDFISHEELMKRFESGNN